MKYPICQTENREGRKFCSRCGEPLQIICASSQAVNEPGEDYRGECVQPLAEQATKPSKPHSRKPSNIEPASFADGRYQVKKLLGEGGKKNVYFAHDTLLDRDIAFALIKTEIPELASVRS